MKYFLFVSLNVLTCAISCQLTQIFFSRKPPWLRAMAILAGFAIVVLVALMVVGTIASLRSIYLAGLLASITLVLSVVTWRRKPTIELTHGSGALSVSAEELLAENIGLALFAAFGGILAIRVFWNGTAFFSDDYACHATAVAHWIVQQDLSTSQPT